MSASYCELLTSMNLQVPLGVLPKCETQRTEMIDIMSSLQRYVPHLESATNTGSTQQKHDEVVHQLMFGGDQLTAARARGGQEARLNSDTCLGRLQGLKPMAEDWHTSVILLIVCELNYEL